MNKSYRIRQRFRSFFWVLNSLIDQNVGTHKRRYFQQRVGELNKLGMCSWLQCTSLCCCHMVQ